MSANESSLGDRRATVDAEILRRMEEDDQRRNESNRDAVLAAVKDKAPSQVTQTVFYDIEPTDVEPRYRGTKVQINSVRVMVRRYAAGDPRDDGTGYVTVEGYGVPLTQKGEPSRSASARWYHLPNELAAQLLLQAHTHSTDRRED